MSFETLTNQQLKSLLALRKDVAIETSRDLNNLLLEIQFLEELLRVRENQKAAE